MLSAVLTLLISLNTTGASDASPNTTRVKTRQGPIEFKCDSMQVLTKPNRGICRDNVIVRRGDLMVCCSQFVGAATPEWEWSSFTCEGNVVAQRTNETMWSNKATFNLKTSELVLTGAPLLQRGKSYLQGSKITLNIHNDLAQISQPRGVMIKTQSPSAPTPSTPGPLPKQCPLPPRPRK